MVIIKDMDMPENCVYCKFGMAYTSRHGLYCMLTMKDIKSPLQRMADCPLMDGEQVERELAESYFPRRCQRTYTEEEIKEIEELMMEDWSS